MLNNSGKRKSDVGHGDDEVGAADVVSASTVGHVVDPLVLVGKVDVARVLTREPVVASGVGVFSAVDPLDDPPVSCNLIIQSQNFTLVNLIRREKCSSMLLDLI